MAGGALLPGWLLWSLPAMFLLHDAEEVLFLPPWLRRNRELLARRFPQLARRMLPHFDGISPLRFAAMAAEELVLLVAVTACAALAGCYYPDKRREGLRSEAFKAAACAASAGR